MQERHAIAATFQNRQDAESCMRDLEAQGVPDKDIRVLLPSGSSSDQFTRDTGTESRVVTGGSILDQLSNAFQGGASGLGDLGFTDQEQKALEDSARRGEYVVAVKCDGVCQDADTSLYRWSGRRTTPEALGTTEGGRERGHGRERPLREQQPPEYGEHHTS